MRTRVLVILFVMMLVPAAARAQERGQFGAVLGYPTSIGFLWHVSDRIAVRPEINVANTSTEAEESFFGQTFSSDSWSVNGGASLLWYLQRADNVRTYFSPKVTFGYSSGDSSTNDVDPRTANTLSTSFSLGAQYTPVRKFSVFGEVGYGFSRGSSDIETPFTTSKLTNWNWGVRSAVGVIFYFGRS
jgi:hypothetical protein